MTFDDRYLYLLFDVRGHGPLKNAGNDLEERCSERERASICSWDRSQGRPDPPGDGRRRLAASDFQGQ